MTGMKAVAAFAVVVVSAAMGLGGKWAEAQVQHVVGGDRGWDPSSGVASWSSRKVFRVGDRIWFAYSAAQGSVAEVRTRGEYEACDVRHPIKMYTDGMDHVPLDAEGSRFFASTNPDHCKDGLKLNVQVLPRMNKPTYPGPGILQVTASDDSEPIIIDVVAASGPTSSFASGRLGTNTGVFAFAFLLAVLIIGFY